MKLGIAANDAGAANHLFAWLESGYLSLESCLFSCAGPALNLLKTQYPSLDNTPDQIFLDSIDQLITGTSWPCPFEQGLRQKATQKDIKTVAVIDHWTHYRERFMDSGKLWLPDEIWVTDDYALALAKTVFSNVPIILKPNHYLQRQVEWIKNSASHSEGRSSAADILFVMEPVPTNWGREGELAEIQALEYFLLNRSKLGLNRQSNIIIKPHPSDPPGKYNVILGKYPDENMVIDETSALADLIAGVDWVIGCQTYALVVAMAAGKKVVSAMPDYAPPCVLPHKQLIHLRDQE